MNQGFFAEPRRGGRRDKKLFVEVREPVVIMRHRVAQFVLTRFLQTPKLCVDISGLEQTMS